MQRNQLGVAVYKARELDGSQSPLAFFGAEVRRARMAAGMSLGDLADLVPCSKSTVSRVESGLLEPDDAFIRACDTAFPGMDKWFSRFWAAQGQWMLAVSPPFRSFVPAEERATALYVSEHSFIPGLLAPKGYSHAVLSRHIDATPEVVAARLGARMRRQAILEREDPPRLWAVIDDSALTRRIGSPEIMRDALAHLADMAQRPNITIQVLEDADAHVGLQGACTIAEVGGAAISVNLDDLVEGRVCDDRTTVSAASVRFRWLQAEALSPSASQAFIGQRIELWDRATPVGARVLTPALVAASASK